MKTFNVISASVITKAGTEPFVGLTVRVNGKEEQIARTCKQALLDLHNSARGTNIPSGLFDNGVANANPMLYNQFRDTIIGMVGKVGFADVTFHEAGESYEATELSSAVRRGEAKVGEQLVTLKKGSRVEGFINFPLTDVEIARKEAIASINPMMLMQGLFGITIPTAEPIAIKADSNNAFAQSEDNSTEREIFGQTPDFASFEETLEEEPANPTTTKAKAK